jgi:hypothetical protein
VAAKLSKRPSFRGGENKTEQPITSTPPIALEHGLGDTGFDDDTNVCNIESLPPYLVKLKFHN